MLRTVIIVVLVWAAVFLPGLGSTELKGEEGRRILPAVHMLRTGDFVLPWSEGRPYHRKPPLINWAIAGSFRLTGVANEWTARLPSALSVLALALTGVWAGRRLAGDGGALWLPLAMLSTIGVVEKGRLAEIEAMFVSLSGMGMLVWLAGWRQGGRPWMRWVVAGALFGLAGLAKGPVFLPFFYAIALAVLWRARELRELVHPAHGAGLLLTFGAPGVWAALARRRLAEVADSAEATGEQAQVWLDQVLKRLDPSKLSLADWIGVPLQSLLLLSPWAVVAVILWRVVRRAADPDAPPREDALIRGLGRGILASGLVFALLPESRARFLLPLAAPVAALAVVLAARWQRSLRPRVAADGRAAAVREPAVRQVWSKVCRGMFLAITLAGAVLPFLLLREEPVVPAVAVATGSGLLWIVAVRLTIVPAPARIFGETALLAAWGILLYTGTIVPWMARNEDIRPPAERILEVTGPDPVLAAFHAGPQPFLFYLGPNCVEAVSVAQMPPDATHILIPEERWNRPGARTRFENRGFLRAQLRVTDDDGTVYVLVPREGERARKPADGAG